MLLAFFAPPAEAAWPCLFGFLNPKPPKVPALIEQGAGVKVMREKKTAEARRKYGEPKDDSVSGKVAGSLLWSIAAIEGIHLAIEMGQDPKALVPAALLGARAGMEVADTISWLVHVALDKILDPDHWLWGGAVRAFLRHHVAPELIAEKSYWSMVAKTAKLTVPLFAATTAVSMAGGLNWMLDAIYPGLGVMAPAFGAGLWTNWVAGSHGTNFHAAAHMSGTKADPSKPQHKQPAPWIYRALRVLGMGITVEDHNQHHDYKQGYDRKFAIITGNTNRFFDKFKVADKVGRFKYWLTGKMPHNWIQAPGEIPEDIRNGMIARTREIPLELLYTYHAFPERLTPEMRERLKEMDATWRTDFIAKRRRFREIQFDVPLKGQELQDALQKFGIAAEDPEMPGKLKQARLNEALEQDKKDLWWVYGTPEPVEAGAQPHWPR